MIIYVYTLLGGLMFFFWWDFWDDDPQLWWVFRVKASTSINQPLRSGVLGDVSFDSLHTSPAFCGPKGWAISTSGCETTGPGCDLDDEAFHEVFEDEALKITKISWSKAWAVLKAISSDRRIPYLWQKSGWEVGTSFSTGPCWILPQDHPPGIFMGELPHRENPQGLPVVTVTSAVSQEETYHAITWEPIWVSWWSQERRQYAWIQKDGTDQESNRAGVHFASFCHFWRLRILMTKRPVTFCYKIWQILGTLAEISLKELTLKTWSESSESSAKKPTTCAKILAWNDTKSSVGVSTPVNFGWFKRFKF